VLLHGVCASRDVGSTTRETEIQSRERERKKVHPYAGTNLRDLNVRRNAEFSIFLS